MSETNHWICTDLGNGYLPWHPKRVLPSVPNGLFLRGLPHESTVRGLRGIFWVPCIILAQWDILRGLPHETSVQGTGWGTEEQYCLVTYTLFTIEN